MKNSIDITKVNLVEFAKKVYELSVPQGLGFLHYKSEPLSDEEAKECIIENKRFNDIVLDMDYVNGRACKMVVWEEDGIRYIRDSWYDHTDVQFETLLKHFNIEKSINTEHNCACNCLDCQAKR